MNAAPDIHPESRGGWFFGLKFSWPWGKPKPTMPTETTKILRGDGTWPFVCEVRGKHLLVRGKFATWFGGPNDPSDDGRTASGVDNRRPGVLGCALPMDIGGFKPTKGSPIPRLPYKSTFVTIRRRDTGATVRVPLIDLGPSKSAAADGDAIDLTPATFAALGVPLKSNGNPTLGRLPVDFVIENGAPAT